MQQQRRVGPQQGYYNQGAGGYQQGQQQQNQGSKARFINPMIQENALCLGLPKIGGMSNSAYEP